MSNKDLEILLKLFAVVIVTNNILSVFTRKSLTIIGSQTPAKIIFPGGTLFMIFCLL